MVNWAVVKMRNHAFLRVIGIMFAVFALVIVISYLAAIPNAEFQAIDDAGHNLYYENPEAVNASLRDFFLRANH